MLTDFFLLVAASVAGGSSSAPATAPVAVAVSPVVGSQSYNGRTKSGTHVVAYTVSEGKGASVGISELDGPSYPLTAEGGAELFFVTHGSATITQANGHDIPVKAGDCVLVPRGVAYGGRDFKDYKHAYVVFDRGTTSVPGGPTEVTALRPQSIPASGFVTEGDAKRYYMYRGGDGSTVRLWQSASGPVAKTDSPVVMPWSEFSVVLRGTITLTSGGKTWSAKAGDVFFAPKGATIAYTSTDLEKLAVVTDTK